jgi:hypothetical protein
MNHFKTHFFRGLGLLFILLLLAHSSSRIAAAPPDPHDFHQPFAGDVYVLDGATLRNPTGDTAPDAPLFNVAGASLDLTWGDWLKASVAATARTIGGPGGPRTDVRIQLSGLVPGGVYSLFYITFQPDSEHPWCPGVERSLPLTAFHPDQQFPDASSFVPDSNGEAEYRARVDGALLEASQLLYTVIYHFDGLTYHPFPNRGEYLTQGEECRSSFGEDAMRQLLIFQKF